MNRIIIMSAVLLCLGMIACEKQNEYIAQQVQPVLQRSEAYYANLRAYKKSDHQIFYGWFGGLGTPGSADAVTGFDHLPDSVDIVSMWGGLPPLGSYNDLKMKENQQLKGTRFVSVSIASDNFLRHYGGEDFFEEYIDQGRERMIEGFALVAQNIAKEVNDHGLDGYDLDYEPGSSFLYDPEIGADLVIELGKLLGPQSTSGKLLIVDAFTERLPNRVVPYLDYFVVQAYSPQGGSTGSMLGRFGQVAGMPYEKCIAGENFEDNRARTTGGRLLEYAAWNPPGRKKGGVAVYHPEYEYTLSPDYRWSRQAIQIMNPAVR